MINYLSVVRALLEGVIVTVVGLLAAAAMLYFGPWSHGFASRWSMGCTGWTTGLALANITGHLLHWYSYVTIAIVMHRLHPVLKNVATSWLSIRLITTFIFGCGLTHLIAAYTVIDPIYDFEVYVLIANGVLSCVSAVFVAFSLVIAFDFIKTKRYEWEQSLKEVLKTIKK